MKVAILDDWVDTLRTLSSFAKLAGQDVTVFSEHVDDVDELARRLCETEVLVLIRERTAIRAELLDRLNRLRLISQRSVYPHIDAEAYSRRGVIVSSDLHPGTPSTPPPSSTWAPVLTAARQMAALRAGHWQIGLKPRSRQDARHLRLRAHRSGRRRIRPGLRHARAGLVQRVYARPRTRGAHEVAAERDALFADSDVLSLHLRLVDVTRRIVTARDLARMKPSALLGTPAAPV